jgi:hypothetical protein
MYPPTGHTEPALTGHSEPAPTRVYLPIII